MMNRTKKSENVNKSIKIDKKRKYKVQQRM